MKNKNSNKDTVIVIDDVTSSSTTESSVTLPPQDQVNKYGYFTTPIYHISKQEFLPLLQGLADKLLAEHEKEIPTLHPIYPVRQTGSLLTEPQLKEFFDYVGEIGRAHV